MYIMISLVIYFCYCCQYTVSSSLQPAVWIVYCVVCFMHISAECRSFAGVRPGGGGEGYRDGWNGWRLAVRPNCSAVKYLWLKTNTGLGLFAQEVLWNSCLVYRGQYYTLIFLDYGFLHCIQKVFRLPLPFSLLLCCSLMLQLFKFKMLLHINLHPVPNIDKAKIEF